ncbi:MAG TPA: protein translocase subunit SecD [Streptosporangiaceae bacterium]|nr:protein translocase subunit SecD [Streptosporangiaceae bacterium]
MAPRSTPSSYPGRYLTALVVLLIVMALSVLGGNIFKPADWHKSFKVGLGLDLSSGTSVTLRAVSPNGKPVSQGSMTKAIQIMTNRVEATGLTGSSVVQQGSNQIVVSVPGAGAQKVATLVGETALLRLRQVLLVAPNTSTGPPPTTPNPAASGTPSTTPTTSSSASPTASPGASSASPSSSGGSGQAVGASKIGASSTPSPSTSASTSPAASASPSASPSPSASGSGKPTLSTTADGSGDPAALTPATVKLFDKLNCTAKEGWKQQIYHSVPNNWDNPKVQTVTCFKAPGTNVWQKYAMSPAIVQGSDLSGVQAVDQTTGWAVTFNVKSPASSKLGALTTTMSSKYYSASTGSATSELDFLAIVLDGQLQGAPPQVQSAISTSGQINGGTGGFSQSQATTLADVLKYGSLPLSFHNLFTSSVSASLGADQLSAGLFAALVGLLLVVLYSFLYYRGLGVVSVLSLAIAASLSYLSVVLLSRYEGFTLSLAGIAGLIVAIGITADSFIVYFERLRDEVREGRSLRTAVERGWTRARRTILVSDTVSFLAALLLYILSEGDVRGFAFTLGLTTLVDVLVVFLFTKPMITLLARTKFYGQGHPLSGLDPGRLGARAPWRGGRRPAASPGSAATAARTSTTPREA